MGYSFAGGPVLDFPREAGKITKDFYRRLLGVGEEATPEELKAAYRRLCLLYHPDRAGPEAMAKMAAINEAYEALVKGGATAGPGTKVPPQYGRGARQTVLYKDQAYAFYRHAQRNFLELRNASARVYPGLYRAGGGPELDAFEARLLVALHYFSLVCRDYPDSEWRADAEEKLKLLERDLLFVRNMRARPPEGGKAPGSPERGTERGRNPEREPRGRGDGSGELE